MYRDVREALATLPVYFRTETHIAGVMATDLHTLNDLLGAAIEEQVVRTLNSIRNSWDPDEQYALYSFVRQAQTFPDVLLRKAGGEDILLGLELKDWYLLAKEAEPSLRFETTAEACAAQDMVVVVPWVLSNVISGSPILFEPFVESAKYAAEYRNSYWQRVRRTKDDTHIDVPFGVGPYPVKSDSIADKPRYDGGGNFGRLARTGMMDPFKDKLNQVPVCGIKIMFWRQFLKAFRESTTDDEARAALDRLKKRIRNTTDLPAPKAEAVLAIVAQIEQLLDLN